MRSSSPNGSGGVRTARARRDRGPVLVTGGAGFVGTNLCSQLAAQGEEVVVFDDLSRPGAVANLRWLRERHGARVRCVVGDVRDRGALLAPVREASWVVHLAAQVAVTTSLLDPLADFETNAGGTLNLLEALRACDPAPPLLFTSTNKVYGALDAVALTTRERRVEPAEPALQRHGVGETHPLDLHSPYACSKGAAELYVRDYARCFGLRTVVFRMSCIYGPHQHGSEDQGWVGHFLRRAVEGRPITLFGDGRQVRDLLFVGDLVRAMLRARDAADRCGGSVFNVGGGPRRSLSLLELLDLVHELTGLRPRVRREAVRVGDQRYYASDTRHVEETLGWRPRVSPREGVARTLAWLREPRLLAARGAPRAGAAAS